MYIWSFRDKPSCRQSFSGKPSCKQCYLEIKHYVREKNLHVNNVILKKVTTQKMSLRDKLLRKYCHFFIIQISCYVKTSYLWHLKNNRHVNIETSVVFKHIFKIFYFSRLVLFTPVGYLRERQTVWWVQFLGSSGLIG